MSRIPIVNDPLNTSRQPRSVGRIPWIPLTLLLLSLLAALPLWTGPGILNTRSGGDSPFLFFRLQQLVTNLRDGAFPARWMPDAAYGLGYPFFNYYASLPYYFGAIFNLLGFDVLISIKIVQTLGFVFAAFAMFRWADRHFNARPALRPAVGQVPISWLIAVAYVYAPFHFVNVYVRGDSLSEFYAFIFYPLILLAIDRVIESPRSFHWLALAYGGLILTHNVSALIFSPFVVIYAILQVWPSQLAHKKHSLLSLTFGLVLAFALSAWFWLPALGESNLAQLDVQTTGYFNYAEHFRSSDLVQASIGFDYAITTEPGSNTPFAMGLVQALATLIGLIALAKTWRTARAKSLRVFAVIGLALSTFMITPLSRGLWDHLPLLPFAQFPWRFLSIQSLFTALIIGYCLSIFPARRLSFAIFNLFIGAILVASMLLPLQPDYLPIRADEITPDRLQLYEAFTSNIGTTIRAEYLPRTVTPRPYTGLALIDPSLPPEAIAASGVAASTQLSRTSIRQTWQVTVLSDTARLDFPLLYWPGWTATIDGQSVEAIPAPDLGYVQIDVPHGEHRVEFDLGRTPIRAAAETISLIASILLVLSIVWRIINDIPLSTFQLPTSISSLQSPLVILLFFAAMLVLQSRYPVPANENDLTMDFDQRPWLHHNPGGVDFGDSVKLIGYQISETRDQSMTLSLNWAVATTQTVSATIALVAPSMHLFAGPSPIDQHSVLIQSGSSEVRLIPPYRLSTGMYYVRVQVGSIDQYLRPIWFSAFDRSYGQHDFGQLTPMIGLAAAQTQQLDSDHLDVRLSWSVSGSIDVNYGISLRLRDAAGRQWTALDTQPGYGFQPTSAWQRGALIDDAYTLSLPNDLPRDGAYALDVILYRVASKEEVGRTTLDNIPLGSTYTWRSIEPPPRDFVEPPVPTRVDAIFGDQIELLGYDLAQDAATLIITPTWKAVTGVDSNYKVFVHVFDPATEKIVAQSDAMPRDNAYPTSRWLRGEVISDTIVLPLDAVPPGSYRIAIGLYDPATSDRLPIGGDRNIDAANRRVILDDVIVVP